MDPSLGISMYRAIWVRSTAKVGGTCGIPALNRILVLSDFGVGYPRINHAGEGLIETADIFPRRKAAIRYPIHTLLDNLPPDDFLFVPSFHQLGVFQPAHELVECRTGHHLASFGESFAKVATWPFAIQQGCEHEELEVGQDRDRHGIVS